MPPDQAGTLGPVGEVRVDLPCQLANPRSVTRLAVLIDRRPPRRFGQPEQRFADWLGERIPERKADAGLAARLGEIMAGSGRIRAREYLPVQCARWQLLERQVQKRKMILGVVRASVPRPQDPGQDLPATGNAISGLNPKPL